LRGEGAGLTTRAAGRGGQGGGRRDQAGQLKKAG